VNTLLFIIISNMVKKSSPGKLLGMSLLYVRKISWKVCMLIVVSMLVYIKVESAMNIFVSKTQSIILIVCSMLDGAQ